MAQVVPDICPREKEFASIMRQMREDLVRIVHGDLNKYTFILFCSSGMITMDFKGGNWMVNKKKIRKKTGKADKDCRGVCLSWRSEHQWRCGFRAKRRAWHHAFQKYPEWILFKEYFQKGQEWKAHTGTGWQIYGNNCTNRQIVIQPCFGGIRNKPYRESVLWEEHPKAELLQARVFSQYDTGGDDYWYDWKQEVITRILRNPVYKGGMYVHTTSKPTFKSKGRGYIQRADREIQEDVHEAVVTKEVWQTVQDIIDRHVIRARRAGKDFLCGRMCKICVGGPAAGTADQYNVLSMYFSQSG